MKNRIKTIRNSIFVALLITLGSCDALNVEQTSVIGGNSFWKTEDDVKASVNGMYFQLRNINEGFFLVGESRAETSGLGVGGSGGYDIYYLNTLNASTVGVSWQAFYTVINTSNQIIKYAQDIPFNSQAEKNTLLAQAYAMRAYLYFVMAKSWGDLIIHTEPIESMKPDVTYKERSPVKDVFDLIKSDIEKSLELFADNTEAGSRIAWSKPGVNAIKGDVYLWTGKLMGGGQADFKTALDALNQVVQEDVELLPEFEDIFSTENKGNKEMLMSIRYTNTEGSNFYWHTWLIAMAVPVDVDEETKNIVLPGGSGQGLTVPTRHLNDQYVDGDTRKRGTLHEIYTHDGDNNLIYYTSIALKGKGEVKDGQRYFTSDLILYRYGDVLLLIAEAKNALGMDPSVEVNQIRKRAFQENYPGHEFVSGSKTYNDQVILKERLLELSFECKRWWDLLRFDKAFELVPSLKNQQGKDHLKLFPISLELLSKEPKVKQNPGY